MSTEDKTLLRAFFERLSAHVPLLERYRKDPALFFSERGVRFFREFQKLFSELYSQKTRKAVVLAPRGGGKTFGAAMLATAFFLFRDFDVGIVAGSETQALALFSYIAEWLEIEDIGEFVERMTRTEITGISGNRIVARTASARSIRGLHLGRSKRGALLIIDEEAEADEEVVRAARYTVRTAEPALIMRLSTYHKLSGSFADLVENHASAGYELYKWSSFDAAKPCEFDCASCPVKEFQERYCRGTARTAQGWIDVREIVGEWRDSSRETFEVEVMGMRPASAGLVISPEAIDRAVVKVGEYDEFGKKSEHISIPRGEGEEESACHGGCYINNSLSEARNGRAQTNNENDLWNAIASQGSDPAPRGRESSRGNDSLLNWSEKGVREGRIMCYGLDWGFAGMTAVVVLSIVGGEVRVVHTESFERQGIEEIVRRLKELRERFGAREVFADSSHPFENSRLRDEGFAVWGPNQGTLGVPFVSFKEEGVAMLSWLFEKGRIRIPESEVTLLRQLRSWRRDAQGHIVKKNDHFPDALVAAMMKLKLAGAGGSSRPRVYSTSRRRFTTI